MPHGSSEAPALSIVIPTHDTRELLERCLLSLRHEGGPCGEIVVVDDGSGDGTAESLAASFSYVRVLRHPTALGFTASANDGLTSCRGDILLLLNSDTEVAPGGLTALCQAFEDPQIGVAGANLFNPDGSPQWSAGREPTLAWLFGLSSGAGPAVRRVLTALGGRAPGSTRDGPADWVSGAAMAIRRSTLQEIGPLEDAYRFYVQDMDFCLRARASGWTVRVVSGFRVMHVGGATIGRRRGASRAVHHEMLWLDLLEWASLRKSRRWARMAGQALLLGAQARRLGRWLRRGGPGVDRAAFDRESEAQRRACAALRGAVARL